MISEWVVLLADCQLAAADARDLRHVPTTIYSILIGETYSLPMAWKAAYHELVPDHAFRLDIHAELLTARQDPSAVL